METLSYLFGSGQPGAFQMSVRAVVVFILGIAMIRLSGRRSFGMRMPLDNVIIVLIGSVLSRAVNGSSSFIGTIIACFIIVILHRLVALLATYNSTVDRWIKGKSQVLYKNGNLNRKLMRKFTLTEKDIIEGVRINSNLEEIEDTKSIYLERDGQISAIKKQAAD